MNKFVSEIKKSNNEMAKNVVIDLDGVIIDFNHCKNIGICDYSNYPDCLDKLKRTECPMNSSARLYMGMMKKIGMNIIIWTARVEEEREVTEEWLKKNKIPYDDLIMGKPRATVYIDDLAHRFINWELAYSKVMGLSK